MCLGARALGLQPYAPGIFAIFSFPLTTMSKRLAGAQINRDHIGVEEEQTDGSESFAPFTRASEAVMSKRKIIQPRGRSGVKKPVKSMPAAVPAAATAAGGDSKDEMVRALNESVLDQLNQLNQPGVVCDFSPVFTKYIEYYQKIQNGEIGKSAPAPSSAPAAAPVAPVAAATVDSSSDSDSDDDIKIEGPQFTIASKPTMKNSPFSFNPKKPKPKDDSDSESEIEITGPVFTFNKPIKDSVFKVAKDVKEAPKETAKEESKPAESLFSFSKKEEKKDDKPAFSFGSGSLGFSFGKTEEKKDAKPAFSFGAKPEETKTEEKSDKPAFTFGAKPQDSAIGDKPAFSFGAKSEDKSDKPAFSFGAKSDDKSDKPTEKPSFSFGAKSDDKPAFSFSSKPDDKPAFSFGAKPADKPAFSFSSKSEEKTDKPAFSFSASKPEEKSDKPAFSFGTSKPEDKTDKPAFSFSNASADKPAFSFGAKADDKPADKPAFSFGTKPEDKETPSSDKPAFSFSDKPAFSFVSSQPSFSFSNNASKPEDAKADTKTEEKVEESDSTANFKPVVQLTEKVDSNTGEENETAEFTKRAKLMLYEKENNPPYTTKGVGELKVLKNNETGKSRLLIRTDGGLRVLLNLSIQPNFKYEIIGDGLLRVPVVNADLKLETYVIKVKTKADGEEMEKIINGLK